MKQNKHYRHMKLVSGSRRNARGLLYPSGLETFPHPILIIFSYTYALFVTAPSAEGSAWESSLPWKLKVNSPKNISFLSSSSFRNYRKDKSEENRTLGYAAGRRSQRPMGTGSKEGLGPEAALMDSPAGQEMELESGTKQGLPWDHYSCSPAIHRVDLKQKTFSWHLLFSCL